MVVAALPLPANELPETIRKFGDPSAPLPARAMAARGMVPVRGADLVTLLVQLSADPESEVADTAHKTLKGMPEGVLLSACEAELHARVLDRLADLFPGREDVLERLVMNHGSDSDTITRLARGASESLSEVIATNQQRLLAAPRIIEALYKNPMTRMSTADRLVELAARHGVELTAIPAFKDHVEAISGQLIPEPTDEPLPSDQLFSEALNDDAEDQEALERDVADGSESVKKKFVPLHTKIGEMNKAEKLRLACVGSVAARSILVRDNDKGIAFAAVSSPKTTDMEACNIAHSREVGEDILRYIGNRREWLRNYELKRALVFNSKTPVGISLRFLGHLRENDLKLLTRSRNVPSPLKSAAMQRFQKRQSGKK